MLYSLAGGGGGSLINWLSEYQMETEEVALNFFNF